MSDALVLDLDPDTFTIGELEDFEEAAGQPFQQAFSDPNAVSAKALKAVVWILRRRENPDYSLDDAREVLVTSVQMQSPKDQDSKDSDPTAAATAG